MLRVIHPGFYSTIQDLGRYGYRHFGVPVAGVADQISASRVNALLENNPQDALLEMTMQGATLEFLAPTFICFAGGEMEVTLDQETLESDRIYQVNPNQILRCGRISAGLRTYLGIRGGFKEPVILGSRSYFKGITPKIQIATADLLDYCPDSSFEPKILKYTHPDHIKEKELMCSKGPEYNELTPENQLLILKNIFTIGTAFNRMGCQLTESVNPHQFHMTTSPTLPGTVQITPSGKVIILLCDGQTTGGYPRALQLSEEALAVVAQKRQGDSIKFKLDSMR